jgi:hypothetical protein
MKTSSLIRLSLIAGICLMFSNTLGSLLTAAQTLDRVTADKVAEIAADR